MMTADVLAPQRLLHRDGPGPSSVRSDPAAPTGALQVVSRWFRAAG
jgi:hypothetical protein